MANILIVEDNKLIAQQLKQLIYNINKEREVLTTGYASEALEIMKYKQIALFLLDIQLEDYSGIELGKKIRETSGYELIPIVFITSIPTQELEAFRQIHCYDYITKPFTPERIEEVLVTLLEKGIKNSTQNLELKLVQKHFTLVLKQSEIVYIEARNRKLIFVTEEEVLYISTYTLKDIDSKLGKNFLRCHRGFIVNEDYIKGVDRSRNNIELKHGYAPLPIGEKYKKILKGKWI